MFGYGTALMEAKEEINKELEAKLKRLEEDIANVIEHNNRLRGVLHNLRTEERMTLEWLCECTRREERTGPQVLCRDLLE